MKKTLLISVLLLVSAPLYGSDNTSINLYSPTSLSTGMLNFSVRHRFFGDIADNPFSNFFGMDAGANVRLSLSYQPVRNFIITTGYTRLKKEKTLGIGYKLQPGSLPFISQIDLEYFSFKEEGLTEDNRSNILAILSLQNKPLFDRFTGTVNIGYDGYYQHMIAGAGLNIIIKEDFWLFEQIALVGEYYPVLDRGTANGSLASHMGPEDAFAFAVKMDTYGHRFFFVLTNTNDLNLHRTGIGTEKDSHLRFGFNIERRLQL